MKIIIFPLSRLTAKAPRMPFYAVDESAIFGAEADPFPKKDARFIPIQRPVGPSQF
jgi:hypothetical protein